MISWAILMMLTFSDGTFVQGNVPNVSTEAECQAIIQQWTVEMLAKYKDATNPTPSTFLTGCTQETK